jgi:hypothetical protein
MVAIAFLRARFAKARPALRAVFQVGREHISDTVAVLKGRDWQHANPHLEHWLTSLGEFGIHLPCWTGSASTDGAFVAMYSRALHVPSQPGKKHPQNPYISATASLRSIRSSLSIVVASFLRKAIPVFYVVIQFFEKRTCSSYSFCAFAHACAYCLTSARASAL